LQLSFDGESCTYQGPAELNSGPVTLIFLNESEAGASANMVRHTRGKTIQDMKDTFVAEPKTGHRPGWATEIKGLWDGIPVGESNFWEGILEPGRDSGAGNPYIGMRQADAIWRMVRWRVYG
jgi:hypothetical protein